MAPLMVQQGAEDLCTEDADALVIKMRTRGADLTYLVYKDEGHNLDNLDKRVDFITSEIEFFLKHLKPNQYYR